MHVRRRNVFAHSLMLTAVIGTMACGGGKPKPGTVLDEAMRAKRTVDSFPAADEDYFHDMDGGLPLTKEQIQGRNMWIVWTGGNDRLWDVLSRREFRLTRLPEDGLVSSDAALLARHPLDVPRARERAVLHEGHGPRSEPLRAVARRARSGVRARSVRERGRGTRACRSARAARPCRSAPTTAKPPASSACGCSPTRTSTRRRGKSWDSERYYRDPTYYEQRDLVKPYRVGMSCAFCHVGPEPGEAAGGSGEPAVGESQLERRRAVSSGGTASSTGRATTNEQSFLYQALHTSLPGTLDTSLVSTDNINNPRTMNAVYYLGPRMGAGEALGQGDARGRRPRQPAVQRLRAADRSARAVLRAAVDDVDAARAEGRLRFGRRARRAQSRVSEHRPLQRGVAAPFPAAASAARTISPIKIADAQKNSVYWQATEQQTPYMARFFLASTDPHYLKDAPSGSVVPDRGRRVDCARQDGLRRALRALPLEQASAAARRASTSRTATARTTSGAGTSYWAWTKTDAFKAPMREIVARRRLPEGQLPLDRAARPVDADADQHLQPDRDQRHRRQHLGQLLVAVLQGAAVGRHGQAAASAERRRVPTTRCPAAGAASRDRHRSSASGPRRRSSRTTRSARSTRARRSKRGCRCSRRRSSRCSGRSAATRTSSSRGLNIDGPGVGWIQRTTADSYIRVPKGYVPDGLRPLLGVGRRLFPMLFRDGEVSIGPIPKGTPVSLLTSMDLLGADLPQAQQKEHRKKLLDLLKQIRRS